MRRSESLLLCVFEKSPSPPPFLLGRRQRSFLRPVKSGVAQVCPHLLKCFNPAHLSLPSEQTVDGFLSSTVFIHPSIHPIPPRHNMRPGVERHLRSLIPRFALPLRWQQRIGHRRFRSAQPSAGIRFRMTEQTRFLRHVWSQNKRCGAPRPNHCEQTAPPSTGPQRQNLCVIQLLYL